MNYAKAIRENPLLPANNYPKSHTIYAVWSDAKGTTFACAENGVVFKYDGNSITTYDLGVHADFYDVFGFSKNNVWVVGTKGNIFHFDGTTWSKFESPTTIWLEAIWGRSENEIYVAGDETNIFRWNGSKWQQLKYKTETGKSLQNRLYTIGGPPEGPTYVGGSFGIILKIEGDEVSRVKNSDKSHLLGLVHVPKTNDILIGGSKGALLKLTDDKISLIETNVEKSLYGLDANPDGEVVIVGWMGLGLRYKNGKVQKQYNLGNNSFSEGVVYAGNNEFISAGWYGRIMKFSKGEWTTLQIGRAENMNSVEFLKSKKVLSISDTGNYLFGKLGKEHTIHSVLPSDLNFSHRINKSKVLIGGENGYCAIVRVKAAALKIKDLKLSVSNNLNSYSEFDGKLFIGCSDGLVLKYENKSFKEIRIPNTDIQISKIVAISNEDLYMYDKNNSDTVYHYHTDTQKLTVLCASVHDIFKADDKPFVWNVEKLLKINSKGETAVFADLSEHFYSKDEKITFAEQNKKGLLVIGGSRGSIVVLDSKGSLVQKFHSCAYAKVRNVKIKKKTFIAGLSGGRMITGKINKEDFNFSFISAPNYFTSQPYKDGFFIGGQNGEVGLFKKGKFKYLDSPKTLGDVLCSASLADGTVLFGGVEFFGVLADNKIKEVISLSGKIVSSLLAFKDQLFIGTTGGEVFEVPLKSLSASKLSIKLCTNFDHAIVDLKLYNNQVMVVLENGDVYNDISIDSPSHEFENIKLYSSSGSKESDNPWFAGEENFLSNTNSGTVEIPEEIPQPYMHGDVSIGDYWVGGFSGTLLFTHDKKWKKVHTGIGNSLFSVSSTENEVLITGEYGAIRFENRDYIDASIEAEKDV